MRTEPGEQPWEEAVIAAFEAANPDLTIEWVVVPWADFDTTLLTRRAGGDPVDVWSHWGPSGFRDYFLRGTVADLTPFIQRDNFDLSDFNPDVLAIYSTADGRIFGLPLLSGGSFTFYNKKLFQEAGVPFPPTDWDDQSWTWDEAVRRAQLLTKNIDDPTTVQYGMVVGLWPPDALPLLFGQPVFSDEALQTGFALEHNLNTPTVIQAYQARQDLIHRLRVSPSSAALQALGAAADRSLLTGRVAMVLTGVWGLWVFRGLEEQFPWGAAALPKGAPNARDVIFTDPWMLASDSLRPEAGWRFIKFLTEPEQARNYMLATGAPPVRFSLLEEYFTLFPSISPDELRQALLGSISHGIESSNHLLVRFDQINNVLQSALVDPIDLGEGTAAELVPEASQELTNTLRQIFEQEGGQRGS